MNTVNIRDFVEQNTNHKRILVVNSGERVKNYVKAMKTADGKVFNKVVKNVYYKTLNQLAKEVYYYMASETGDNKTIISDMEATIILKKVMVDIIPKCKYFKDKSMITLNMARELYKCINLIRKNGWEEGRKDKNSRIQDLMLLQEEYEAYLNNENLLDGTALYREVLAFIQNTSDKQLIKEVCGGVVNEFCDDSQSGSILERELISELVQATNGDAVIMSENNTIAGVNIPKRRVNFFRGYGLSNEANYVANDILKKKYPLGDVKVVYTSSAQQPFIEAALNGMDISAKFVSPVSLADNDVVDLCRRILEWAKEDYSEKALEKIMSNSSLFVEGFFKKDEDEISKAEENEEEKEEDTQNSEDEDVDETENDKTEEEITEQKRLESLGFVLYNYIGGGKYFEHILRPKSRREEKDRRILGWGYMRNIEFVASENQYLDNEYPKYLKKLKDEGKLEQEEDKAKVRYNSRKKVLELHQALLDVFKEAQGEKVEPGKIYNGILTFIDKYVKKKSLAYRASKSSIYEIYDCIAIEEEMEVGAALAYIDELLVSVTASDKEAYNAVAVEKFNSWVCLDRPHVYFIGMSMKDFQTKSVESPVMRDEDWDKLIKGKVKPTIRQNAERKINDFYRSLNTFNGDSICFGYADFDVVAFSENSPASLFRELISKYSNVEIEELPMFVYGLAEDGYIKKAKTKKKFQEKAYIDTDTSNTTLENYIDCPKGYGYGRRMRIRDDEIIDKNRDEKWLNSAQRGSFFHYVSEQYVNERMVPKSGKNLPKDVDIAYLEQLIVNKKNEYMKLIPYATVEDVEKETDVIRQAAVNYFTQLHALRHKDGKESMWKFLKAEHEFKDVQYSVTSYNNKRYKFCFVGYIDRIDYRISKQDRKIYIRVEDYKTGKQKNKEKSYTIGGLTQHLVYKAAIDAMVKDKTLQNMIYDLEGDEAVKNYKVIFDRFSYVFPMDDIKRIDIPAAEIEGVELTRLKATLTAMEDMGRYPDKVDMFHKIMDYSDDHIKKDGNLSTLAGKIMKDYGEMHKDFAYGCDYCAGKELCLKRKAGVI